MSNQRTLVRYYSCAHVKCWINIPLWQSITCTPLDVHCFSTCTIHDAIYNLIPLFVQYLCPFTCTRATRHSLLIVFLPVSNLLPLKFIMQVILWGSPTNPPFFILASPIIGALSLWLDGHVVKLCPNTLQELQPEGSHSYSAEIVITIP